MRFTDAEERWEALIADLENLPDYAEPDEPEQARGLLREIIREIEVREEPDGVFANPKLNAISGYKCGAEDALPDLYLTPIKLK